MHTRVLKQIASNYLFRVLKFLRLNLIAILFQMVTKLRLIEIRGHLRIFPLCRERHKDDRRYLLLVLRLVMIRFFVSCLVCHFRSFIFEKSYFND